MTAPLCRCCGKPIPKKTSLVWFGQETERRDAFSAMLAVPCPDTKAEAQTLVNQQVVSVRRNGYGEHAGKIWQATVWDGESYRDDLFCTQRCEAQFGRACAQIVTEDGRPRFAMPAYWDALKAQKSAA